MKKLFLAFVFVLMAHNAQAMLIVDIDYTGNIRERIDTCGYGCGTVSTTSSTSNLLSAGGPVANNSVGYAQQFTISKKTKIDNLLVTARIAEGQNSYETLSSNTMYFKLYTETFDEFRGSPSDQYPDAETAALVSSLFVTTYWEDVYYPDLDLWHAFERDGTYTDVPVAFDIKLDPGTYWIAQERYPTNTGYSDGNSGSQNYVDGISVKFAKATGNNHTIVNPEPATILLFSTGLLGAYRLRRNKR